ncbi:MAG: hypothetical protein KDD22_01870 [Bdellovibrionales bacterium]|nr:hypothetical protein [Bdellovibrionales bacterium]
MKTVTFHSIVTSSQKCLDGAGSHMGDVYMELSQLIIGIIGDVCALNQTYQEQLESLAVNIVNEARTYSLSCSNVLEDTAKLYEQTLTGALKLVPSKFIPPNKVVLDNAPAVGSLMKADFICLD